MLKQKKLVNIYWVSADTNYLFKYDFWVSDQYGKFINAQWDLFKYKGEAR